ncbi:MAG TPA: hypothetical protein VGC01_11685 [Mucilaginibacter sp.]
MILNFKKTLFIIAVIAIPAMAFSQKLNKPIVGKFSGDTTLSTTKEKVASSEKFTSSLAEHM